jgi:hypothetical protein
VNKKGIQMKLIGILFKVLMWVLFAVTVIVWILLFLGGTTTLFTNPHRKMTPMDQDVINHQIPMPDYYYNGMRERYSK